MRRIAVLTALLIVGCDDHAKPHDHSEAHPAGHDHHEEGHGHDDGPTVVITLYSPKFELFAEHPLSQADDDIEFLIHLTVLEDFSPLNNATVRIELDGPASVRASTSKNVRPGIFEISVTPPKAGTYRGRVVVEGAVAGTIDGLELVVYPDATSAEASVEAHDDEGQVTFLKEQQWVVPFATSFSLEETIVAAVEAAGRVDTPPGGLAEISAPVTGRVVAPRQGLLRPGTVVKRGQKLASLLPAPSSPEAAARTELAVAEAEARAAAAKAALERAERLFEDQAIAKRTLENARREATVAEAGVRSAARAAKLYAGSLGAAAITLTAPIDGVLDAVHAHPGATVSPRDVLFRIVDTTELWLVARVPEQEAARLRTDRGASYRVAGLETWRTTDDTAVVTVGRTVDPVSRTVDVIYALARPDDTLRVGGLVTLALPVGDVFTGVTVPTSALLNREGRDIVYVQVDGEHFAERAVRVTARAAGRVGISAGLEVGARVVTKGAHLIRLADRASGEPAHGHIH